MQSQDDLDKAFSEIRNEEIDPVAIANASARVLSNIRPLRGCADFQELIPSYRAGVLPENRALLLQDHLHECVECRKVSEGRSRAATVRERFPERVEHHKALRVWAFAALLAIAAGVSAWMALDRLVFTGAGANVVQAASGELYRVSSQERRMLAAGQEFPPDAEIRTAKNSNALIRLRDGSVVQMRERSGFSVSAAGKDTTIRLGQGSILVHAAKRRSGHLFVATRDCKAAVTGTMFSVSSGDKGSRVSVVEGEVHVTQGQTEQALHPGDQFSSSPSMNPVSVGEDVAWARDLNLMREFSALRKELERVPMPDARYSSRLLNMLPADTAVYVSIPNPGKTAGDAREIMLRKLRESPVLRQWWQGQKMPELENILDPIISASDYMGDEIAVALFMAPGEKRMRGPVFLTEPKRPGFGEFFRSTFQKTKQEIPLLVRADVIATSPDASALGRLQGGLNGTPFYSHIAEAYRDGAGLMAATDFQKLGLHGDNAGLGLGDLKDLIIEQKDIAGTTNTKASITFTGQRRGLAALLARPAPIGALEFVSPEAIFAAGFVVDNPAGTLDEFLKKLDSPKLQAELGLSVRNDLAQPLGGNFAFAVDGPLLPVPPFKLAVEVYDPARLQYAIQKIVQASENLRLSPESLNGRTYYKLSLPNLEPWGEVHYTFVDGYLLAAPSVALLDRAIQYRSTGYTLPRSADFQALLPHDRYTSFSAVVYQNAGPGVGALADTLGQGHEEALNELKDMLLKPTVVAIYGESDRIIVASTASLFALKPANLIGFANLANIGANLGAGSKKSRTGKR